MTARIETLWNLGGEKEDTEKKKKERKEDTENVYTAYKSDARICKHADICARMRCVSACMFCKDK